jgi:hypothetical protein
MERKYTAIIVEPRKHKALEFVLDNFLNNLNNDWSIIIYHGLDNIDYINNIINNKLLKFKDRISLINLNVNNLSIYDYNQLMTNRDFVNNIPTETFLIFQTDTMICEQSKDLINNFMDYDYVGAPWINKKIGNGGLSLRKKSKMLEIIDNCEYDNYINEDEYFSGSCNKVFLKKSSYLEAKQFSIETGMNNKSFGIHKAWLFQDNNILNNQCNNYSKLVELNRSDLENYINYDLLITTNEIYLLIFCILIIIFYCCL